MSAPSANSYEGLRNHALALGTYVGADAPVSFRLETAAT